MSLSGQQRKEILEALVSAFPTKPPLEQMLSFELDKNLDAIALGKDLLEIVFNLIREAEAQGWIENLIRAAYRTNPGNPKLEVIAQTFKTAPQSVWNIPYPRKIVDENQPASKEFTGMTDPVTTLTAFTIAEFAFKKFLESGVGKLGEKFTSTALTKMDELRQKIWDKLRGNSRAEKALQELEKGSKDDLNKLAVYLEDEMKDDPSFATEIRAIAHEININRIQDNSSQIQNISGGKGYQTKMGDNNTNQFGDTHNYYGTPPQS